MVEGGFEAWPALDELFPTFYQGVNHNRGIDGSVIDTSRVELSQRIEAYLGCVDFNEAQRRFPLLAPPRDEKGKNAIAGYDAESVWQSLHRLGFSHDKVVDFLAFPFDPRYIYYETEAKLLNRPRPEFGANRSGNEFFLTVPEPRKETETRPIFSTTLANLHVHERGSVVFPREMRGDDLLSDRDANIGERTWRILSADFGRAGQRRDDDARAFVGKLFRVGFAVLHAPAYQSEHKSALSADWAHLPIPKDPDLFEKLVAKGEQVARLLDANRDARDVIEAVLGRERAALLGPLKRVGGGNIHSGDLKITVSYWGGSRGRWKPRPFTVDETPLVAWGEGVWGELTGDLYINENVFFGDVPEAVWTYQLGGYPVLKKWLGYRQADRRDDKPLTDNERKWFRQIVQRVAALLALGEDLDALYQAAAADAYTAADLGIDR